METEQFIRSFRYEKLNGPLMPSQPPKGPISPLLASPFSYHINLHNVESFKVAGLISNTKPRPNQIRQSPTIIMVHIRSKAASLDDAQLESKNLDPTTANLPGGDIDLVIECILFFIVVQFVTMVACKKKI